MLINKKKQTKNYAQQMSPLMTSFATTIGRVQGGWSACFLSNSVTNLKEMWLIEFSVRGAKLWLAVKRFLPCYCNLVFVTLGNF